MFFRKKKILVMIAFIVSALILTTLPVLALDTYTVKSGDSLWSISRAYGVTVAQLKEYNNLSTDIIYPGQTLRLTPQNKYTVKSGDTLWLIAKSYNTTVSAIKSLNNLTVDTIHIGQVLYIPSSTATRPQPVTNWPSITYIVKAGDTISYVSTKFGVSATNIMKYNYMRAGDWLNAGQKIAINGFAPRNYAILPGESTTPLRTGKLVDWFLDGQYLIRRNDVFTITDVQTGIQFKVKMLGGYNHSDVEPLTAADTLAMKRLFPVWNWTPRPAVIFFDGMNIAASLSGMPHSFDSISSNNVTGHFDLYLYNSKDHNSQASAVYLQQHQSNVLKAAGR